MKTINTIEKLPDRKLFCFIKVKKAGVPQQGITNAVSAGQAEIKVLHKNNIGKMSGLQACEFTLNITKTISAIPLK